MWPFKNIDLMCSTINLDWYNKIGITYWLKKQRNFKKIINIHMNKNKNPMNNNTLNELCTSVSSRSMTRQILFSSWLRTLGNRCWYYEKFNKKESIKKSHYNYINNNNQKKLTASETLSSDEATSGVRTQRKQQNNVCKIFLCRFFFVIFVSVKKTKQKPKSINCH